MEKPNISSSPMKPSLPRKIAFTLTTFLFLIIAIMGIGELAVHILAKNQYSKPAIKPPFNTAQKDSKLGWKMTPGYSFSGQMKDRGNHKYDVDISYDENGFKAFGDTASGKPKLMFIGDSYTASIEVSNRKSFFNLIGDSLDAEIFAYGQAGFGTLQEFMVFDEWVDRIQPDMVIWEVCSNDFIDNLAALEMVCGYKVGERRPYLQEDGSVAYQRPLTNFDKMQEHVWFLKWLEDKWMNAQAAAKSEKPHGGEYFIATQKREYQPFDQSVSITEKIVEKIKTRLPENTVLVGFNADLFHPQCDEFKRIFELNGFAMLDKPALAVLVAQKHDHKVVKAADGYHWNEKGHELIANGLTLHLRQLMPKPDWVVLAKD